MVTFEDPAVRRAARRGGALAGIGLVWVALLAALGLVWVALVVAVPALVGVVAVASSATDRRLDLGDLRRRTARRVVSAVRAAGRSAIRAARRVAGAGETAWRRVGAIPLPRPTSPLPAVRAAAAAVTARVRAVGLPKRRPGSSAGHRLAHESVRLRREGRPHEAVTLAREAVAAFRLADDRHGEALALNTLALALAQEGRYAEAVDAIDVALTLLCELGDRHREGTMLVNLGTVHRQAGGLESARFCWSKALERLDPDSPESQEIERLLRAS